MTETRRRKDRRHKNYVSQLIQRDIHSQQRESPPYKGRNLRDRHGNDLKYHNQAHARSHLVKADDEDKIRMVFGVPKLMIQIETMFFMAFNQ